MKLTRRFVNRALVAGAVSLAAGRAAEEETFTAEIRGRQQTLRRLHGNPKGPGGGRRIILASGDGGFHSFGEAMASRMADWGYDTFRFDSQHYLQDFTDETLLTPGQAQEDLGVLAEAVQADSGAGLIWMGWSAGAALATLAAADRERKGSLRGLITVALPLQGVLGWRWSDNLQFLPGFEAAGPYFDVKPYLQALPPTPVLMLQSDEDVWVSDKDAEELFAAAREPKRTVLIEGGGHSFPSARDEFFRALQDGLQWMTQQGELLPGN